MGREVQKRVECNTQDFRVSIEGKRFNTHSDVGVESVLVGVRGEEGAVTLLDRD